ncbi:response regulator [Parabacteroides sp. OttesenSCG-928-G07]|nr:response regulator [Parabacteroides sp. OttesenSCG-928-G07]
MYKTTLLVLEKMKLKNQTYIKAIPLFFRLTLLIAIFCTFSLKAQERETHPILVISSYNPDTRNMVSNITEFQEEYGILSGASSIAIENMNTKSLPEAPEWKERMKGILDKYKGDRSPEMVVLLGQEAWSSYISQDALPFESVPILVGMASQNAIYLPDESEDLTEWEPTYIDLESYREEGYYVSGFLYDYDVLRNVDLIRTLFPETRNIALLTDNTYGGVALQTYVKKEMKKIPEINLILLDGRKGDLYTIIDQIQKLPENTAILIGTWRVDKNDEHFLASATNTMAYANPAVPAFTIASSGLGHWAVGGYVPQYRSVGKDLARQAVDILSGKTTKAEIHPKLISNVYNFDIIKLDEWGINRKLLPDNSVLVNDNESIWTKYQYEILLVIITVLSGFLVMVFVFFLRTKRLKDTLMDLQEDNVLIMNNMQSSIKYIKPDFTVKWENDIQYPCIPQYGPDNCFLSDKPELPYCDKCSVIKAMETKQTVDVIKDCDAWGRFIHVLATPVLDKNQNVLGVVFKKDDVTKQKKAEEEMRIAKEKAEESDKLKSAFLANMSHEIRTPLNAIVGFSSLLSVTEDPEEKMEYVSIINNNNDLLLRLINDILDLSKIEAGTLDFVDSDVDVNSLFNEIEQSMRLKVTTPDVKLSFEDRMPNLIIHIDKNRLAQVVTNFLNNAIKFTQEGSITFGYRQLEDEQLYFYVTDTGCGMSEEGAKEVFHRFVKLNSFVQGTGLGLSISETIIKKMEGEIGVDSVLGEGSTFWFKLPASAIVSVGEKGLETKTASQDIIAKNSDAMILVAAKDVNNYLLIQNHLKNFNLMHAGDSDEAIAMFMAYNPDIVLIDLDSPDSEIADHSAIEEIRKTNPTIPVIALTPYSFAEDEERLKQLGYSDYIQKPIKPEQLKKVLGNYLQLEA